MKRKYDDNEYDTLTKYEIFRFIEIYSWYITNTRTPTQRQQTRKMRKENVKACQWEERSGSRFWRASFAEGTSNNVTSSSRMKSRWIALSSRPRKKRISLGTQGRETETIFHPLRSALVNACHFYTWTK